ncbi:MAG: gephyrin-like molybdotransferase Glp [Pseudomonadota bacterium]|nr:gephyrin-like molybdotransferase Glp [Pseudomonadota bacterium]
MSPSKPLTPIADFLRQLSEHALASKPSLTTEWIELSAALGRVLAMDVDATCNIPPLNNSAMDGYACAHADWGVGQSMKVSATCYAGQAPQVLQHGTVMRIFTGAPIPQGADTVVMQENVQVLPNGLVQLQHAPQLGENIRLAGQDVAKGQRVVVQGTRLDAAELGVLASVGQAQLCVYTPLKVSVIATGDELVSAGQPLAVGQIYNSNSPVLVALLQRLGCDVVQVTHLPDDPSQLRAGLLQAAASSDVVLTTGGASVGDADHLKSVLAEIGQISHWKVAIKPGKPVVWGQIGQGQSATALLGLPGNPQSVWVTFLVLVLPYLKQRQGQTQAVTPLSVRVPAGFERKKAQARCEYLRVQLQQGQLVAHPNQSSGVLSSAAWADGFAVIDTNETVSLGQFVQFIPFAGLLN